MSLAANPFIFYNLGCEMIFVLSQRLESQYVTKEKQHKVMNDLLTNLFSRSFASELFAPQATYTHTNVRYILGRIISNTILKLTEPSMLRLIQLMTTMVKCQMLNSRSLRGCRETFDHHVADVLELAPAVPTVMSRVDAVRGQFDELMAKMTPIDELVTFNEIVSFFQSHHVKVSLLLEKKLQYGDGTPLLKAQREPPVTPTVTGPGIEDSTLPTPPPVAREHKACEMPVPGTNMFTDISKQLQEVKVKPCPLALLTSAINKRRGTGGATAAERTEAVGEMAAPILRASDITGDIKVTLSLFDEPESSIGSKSSVTKVKAGDIDGAIAEWDAAWDKGAPDVDGGEENDLLDLLDDL